MTDAQKRRWQDRVRWRMHQAGIRLTRPAARARLHKAPVDSNYGFNRGRPIDRYYIENFLREERHRIGGRVLEIEHDLYARQFGDARVSTCDTLHVDPSFTSATIIADLTEAPNIKSATYDCLIVCQTLQFIFDLRSAVRTMHRILKPGGSALVTVPAASRLHAPECQAEFKEYWRLTSMAAWRLFAEAFGANSLRVSAFGSLKTTQAHLAGLATEDMRRDELERHDPLYELLICVRAVREPHPRG